MSFFFPSSPSTSDATTTSSLASSPRLRVGGGTDSELTITPVTPTVTQQVSPTSPTSPRSPGTAATSTTRAGPGSGSFKVGKKVFRDSEFFLGDDDGEDENENGNGNGNSGYAYGDEGGSVVNPLSRGASDVYQHLYQQNQEHQLNQEEEQQQQQHAATHTTRSGHDHDRGLSDLGANLERSVDRLLRLMAVGESSSYSLSSSASSLSASLSSLLDDRSVISGRNESRKGKAKEKDKGKEKEKSMEKMERRVVEDASPSTTARVSASSAIQGARPLMGVASASVPPVDGGGDEATQARARSHRRRSSHTHARQSGRRLVVHKRQEVGISRDFALIVALCVGFACAIVLVARPAAMMVFSQRGGGWDLDWSETV